jgi:hypothetical protein
LAKLDKKHDLSDEIKGFLGKGQVESTCNVGALIKTDKTKDVCNRKIEFPFKGEFNQVFLQMYHHHQSIYVPTSEAQAYWVIHKVNFS